MLFQRSMLFATALFLVFFTGCKIADLRPESYQYPQYEKKAMELIQAMQVAHKVEQWKTVSTYEATWTEEFYETLGKQSNPFKEPKTELLLSYIPKTFDGQMQITSGKQKGTTWGIDNWQTYRIKDKEVQAKKNKNMSFFIATYQYFIEFPNRITEAEIFDYLGKKEIDGVACEGVMVSWKTMAPQKDLDQYIIWLNSETHRIYKVEYTIRDVFKFIKGAAYFHDYKEFNGLPLPTSMPVESNLVKKGYLHKMSLLDFKANVKTVESLRPLTAAK